MAEKQSDGEDRVLAAINAQEKAVLESRAHGSKALWAISLFCYFILNLRKKGRLLILLLGAFAT